MSEKNKNFHSRVLVVNDEWLVRWSIEKTLIKHQFDVISIESSTEALGLIRIHSFDWLVTDLKMPDINGLKLIQAMKESNPQGKSILITAYSTANIRQKANILGALFVKKPFDVEELVSKIINSDMLSK